MTALMGAHCVYENEGLNVSRCCFITVCSIFCVFTMMLGISFLFSFCFKKAGDYVLLSVHCNSEDCLSGR